VSGRSSAVVHPVARLRAEIQEWCRGRNGWIRLPLVAYLGWFLWQHWADPACWSICAPLNLGVHELGHVVARPFGRTIMVAGGTLAQCGLPLVALAMFIRQRDWFAMPVAVVWLGDNLANVSWYCADAEAQQLQLVSVGGGGEVVHDWNYLLDAAGLLGHEAAIAAGLRVVALACMAAGWVGSGWVAWMMIRPRPAAPPVAETER
jgi:hypothetical protein